MCVVLCCGGLPQCVVAGGHVWSVGPLLECRLRGWTTTANALAACLLHACLCSRRAVPLRATCVKHVRPTAAPHATWGPLSDSHILSRQAPAHPSVRLPSLSCVASGAYYTCGQVLCGLFAALPCHLVGAQRVHDTNTAESVRPKSLLLARVPQACHPHLWTPPLTALDTASPPIPC